MGQTPPGLNENTQRRGSRLWLLVLGLALVLSVYTAISTVQQRQRLNAMVDQLGDSSAAARSQAIGYLFDGDMTEAGRLSDSPRPASAGGCICGFFRCCARAIVRRSDQTARSGVVHAFVPPR
ncbi:MAG: hypothetical protein ACFHWZ_05860 [Phycisphaerales bacterium]